MISRNRRASFAGKLLLAAIGVICFGVPQNSLAVTFNFVNGDSAGEGFNDPTFGAQRINAFQYALGIWDGLLAPAYAGETINITAQMNPLGGSGTSAVLGSAGASTLHRDFSSSNPDFQSSTWYGGPLANHLHESDLIVGTNEVNAQFNTDVDNGIVLGAIDWYYGTDGLGGSDIDFVTVVLHEIGHGLNYSSLITSTGAYNTLGIGNTLPSIYDRYLISGLTGGTALTSMSDSQRLTAITSNNLYWSGLDGIAGNSGVRPKIYAPSIYAAGSSVSHLDETVHTTELMSPSYSGVDHVPSAIELGMLSDMGWTIVPEPSGIFLAAMGLLGIVRMRRHLG